MHREIVWELSPGSLVLQQDAAEHPLNERIIRTVSHGAAHGAALGVDHSRHEQERQQRQATNRDVSRQNHGVDYVLRDSRESSARAAPLARQ